MGVGCFQIRACVFGGKFSGVRDFFPQAVFETPSFTGKSFGWGSQVLGGCFTIMMCNVFGESFWGAGRGSGRKLSN